MKQLRHYSILMCFVLLLSSLITINPKRGYAETPSVNSTTVSTGSQSLDLANNFTLKINNQSPVSSFQFFKGNQGVSSKETMEFTSVEAVKQWEVAGNHYVLVEEREEGSGAYLNFHVFLLGSESPKEIFKSDKLYPQARVEVNDNQLKVTYPVFGKDKPKSDPIAIKADIYQLNQQTLTFEGTQQGSEQNNQEGNYKISGTYQNPSWKEISDYLTQEAIANNIPPEVVKAIAWQESAWRQFTTGGDPVIGFDGRGLGMMQITLSQSTLDSTPGLENSLKYDWKFNVNYGISILKDKWNYGAKYDIIPTINDNDENNIVNWYFAIMAYNGFSKINDPNSSPYTPYQDLIYAHMKEYGKLDVPEINPADLDVYYKDGSSRMYFDHKMHYTINNDVYTKYSFNTGQALQVDADNVSLREDHEANANIIEVLSNGDRLTVTGPAVNPSDRFSHFAYYPVKMADGSKGYVASCYLTDEITTPQTPTPTTATPLSFTDLKKGDHGYNEVIALNEKEIISGFTDGSFRPNTPLTRLQAALMFVRALDLPTPKVSSTGFKDIKAGSPYYREIAAVKKAGIFDGDAKGNFNSNQLLTRGQMAKVICEAFNLKHKSIYTTSFKDIKYHMFKDYVETIYGLNITDGMTKNYFGVNEQIKRVDFSIFLYRVM